MRTRFTSIASIALLFVVGSCHSTPKSWPIKVIAKSKTASGRMEVELRSVSDTLQTGYEEFAAILRDLKGNTVQGFQVEWVPIMDMGEQRHSAPVDTTSSKADSTGAFHAGVVFVMPSRGKDGSWTLRLRIRDPRFTGDLSRDSVDLPLTVAKSEDRRHFSFQAKDGGYRFVALAKPVHPASGPNPLDVFVAKRDSTGLYWPADTGWKVEFIPTMPDMGHGSTDNVQPLPTGKGHHVGKVNFSMGGTWRLTFKIRRDSTSVVDSLDVDVAD